jgi:hypothetical protein
VDLRAGLGDVEKILDPTRTPIPTPQVVQPIASRYTDYAIPAPIFREKNMRNLINGVLDFFHHPEKVQNTGKSVCYIPSPEPFRIYTRNGFILFILHVLKHNLISFSHSFPAHHNTTKAVTIMIPVIIAKQPSTYMFI